MDQSLQPQTVVFVIGYIMIIASILVPRSMVAPWYAVLAVAVWEVIFLALVAVGMNCIATGGCTQYAWLFAIAMVVYGFLMLAKGLYNAIMHKDEELTPKKGEEK